MSEGKRRYGEKRSRTGKGVLGWGLQFSVEGSVEASLRRRHLSKYLEKVKEEERWAPGEQCSKDGERTLFVQASRRPCTWLV